jgi:LysM repeat protein
LKKSSLIVFVFMCVLWAAQAQDASQVIKRSNTVQMVDGKEYFFHSVLQGQTLFSIARAYALTVAEIEAANPDVRDHGLRYNQVIRIPVAKQQASSNQNVQRKVDTRIEYVEHQVKRRETLYGISRTYNVSMEDILLHNPEARTGLRVNMILRIPQKQEIIQSYITHWVLPQQTLFSISREYGVSIEELEKHNPELRSGLKAGQELRIPVEADDVQPPFVVDELKIDTRPSYDPALADPYCHNPKLKNAYNVALLIPLYLEKFDDHESSALTPNHPSFAFIEYYEGMLIAVDSIRKMGADITLHVYDVCDSLPKTRAVLRNPDMAKMDMIIGPFHPNSLELTGEFAKARNITVVSPLYNQDNRLLQKFPNMYQATPSNSIQIEEMGRFAANQFPNDNLIVVHNNHNLVTGFKSTLNRELNLRKYYQDSVNLAKIDGYFLNGVYVGERMTNVYVLNDSILDSRKQGMGSAYNEYMERDNLKEIIFNQAGIAGLKKVMDPDRRNILLSLIGGQALISNYTRQLNQLRDTFAMTVVGVPQWAGYESLDFTYLQNLNVHLFTSEFVDYDQQHNNDFIRRFRNEFHGEPDARFGFKAVQTGMFFFTALMQYGSEFHRCTEFFNETHSSTSPFRFQRVGPHGGWENTFVYFYKYERFRIKQIPYHNREMATHP